LTAKSSETAKAQGGARKRRSEGKRRTDGEYDPAVIKALGHPVRQRALMVLNQRVASPTQIARELGEPVGKVAYHVKILEEVGAIELVETKPSGPSIEHFYRATMRPYLDEEHWSRLPRSVRNTLFDKTLQEIWDHVVAAAEDDGFADPSTHITWTTLELDEEAYERVAARLLEVLEDAIEAHAEAAGRLGALSEDEREARRTELVILHFERSSKVRSTVPARRARRRTR
jgi:DNA-binding transcriptional ArsR family regulator